MSADRAVLAAMVREEWRLHSRLFGGRRFAAFPVFVALVGGLTAWALGTTGAGTGTVVAGAHVLVALFGLQTGTVGLVGRDAMRGLLGDTTLVVFSAHTLPLRQRRLLGLFLLKDVGYYAVPRTGDVDDVATELDCAHSTAGELLRKAEAALVTGFVDGERPGT